MSKRNTRSSKKKKSKSRSRSRSRSLSRSRSRSRSLSRSRSRTPEVTNVSNTPNNLETLNNIDFLNELADKQGIYFISYDYKPKKMTRANMNQTYLVKVGRSNNLKNRLESYLLCYPDGYTIFAILRSSHSSKLETKIHNYLKGKQYQLQSGHTRSEEWFRMSLIEISKTIEPLKGITISHFPTGYHLNATPSKKNFHSRIHAMSTPEKQLFETLLTQSPPKTRKRTTLHIVNIDKSAARRLSMGKATKTRSRSRSRLRKKIKPVT